MGPYARFPLSLTGEEQDGRSSVSIQRSSNLHANDYVDGCNSGDPSVPPDPVPSDCGSRVRTSAFGIANVRQGRTNTSKASLVTGFLVPEAYQACELPGGVGLLDKLRNNAEPAAIRATRPRVGRLFSGPRRIVEQGSATVQGAGIQAGSMGTYTLRLKVVLIRTKLEPARFS